MLLAATAADPPLPEQYRRDLMAGHDPATVALTLAVVFNGYVRRTADADAFAASLQHTALCLETEEPPASGD